MVVVLSGLLLLDRKDHRELPVLKGRRDLPVVMDQLVLKDRKAQVVVMDQLVLKDRKDRVVVMDQQVLKDHRDHRELPVIPVLKDRKAQVVVMDQQVLKDRKELLVLKVHKDQVGLAALPVAAAAALQQTQ
jgi:hypothetical protein